MNKLYLHKNKMRLGQLPFIGVMFGLLFFLLSCMGNLRIQFHWMCRRLSRSLPRWLPWKNISPIR